TGPGRPEPIFSPLTARSGTTPEMLLVRKASLARARSFSLSGWRVTRPRRMTQARVTPGRSGSCTGGGMGLRATRANRLAGGASGEERVLHAFGWCGPRGFDIGQRRARLVLGHAAAVKIGQGDGADAGELAWRDGRETHDDSGARVVGRGEAAEARSARPRDA